LLLNPPAFKTPDGKHSARTIEELIEKMQSDSSYDLPMGSAINGSENYSSAYNVDMFGTEKIVPPDISDEEIKALDKLFDELDVDNKKFLTSDDEDSLPTNEI
jgi:hypothetical protein